MVLDSKNFIGHLISSRDLFPTISSIHNVTYVKHKSNCVKGYCKMMSTLKKINKLLLDYPFPLLDSPFPNGLEVMFKFTK